jgi:hypothetical protein
MLYNGHSYDYFDAVGITEQSNFETCFNFSYSNISINLLIIKK